MIELVYTHNCAQGCGWNGGLVYHFVQPTADGSAFPVPELRCAQSGDILKLVYVNGRKVL